MKYKIAIFDMDGTILNTIEDLTDSTNYALKVHHLPERTIDEVRCFVGNGIRKLIERAVPENSTDILIEDVFETFKVYYADHCNDKTFVYEGISELLANLKYRGIITAVVSNKADFAVQSLCKDYFAGLFDYAVGEKEGIRKKPYPDSIINIIEKYDVTKDEVVYIGDSEVDFQTSLNAGIDSIMVAWGFRTEEVLKKLGAGVIVHKAEELMELICC